MLADLVEDRGVARRGLLVDDHRPAVDDAVGAGELGVVGRLVEGGLGLGVVVALDEHRGRGLGRVGEDGDRELRAQPGLHLVLVVEAHVLDRTGQELVLQLVEGLLGLRRRELRDDVLHVALLARRRAQGDAYEGDGVLRDDARRRRALALPTAAGGQGNGEEQGQRQADYTLHPSTPDVGDR